MKNIKLRNKRKLLPFVIGEPRLTKQWFSFKNAYRRGKAGYIHVKFVDVNNKEDFTAFKRKRFILMTSNQEASANAGGFTAE